MAKITELYVDGAADWIFEITVSYDSNVTYKVMSNPLMEVRDGAAVSATLLTRFDTTGTQDGLITALTSPNRLRFVMEQDKTAALALKTTTGFFDIFADIDGIRTKIAAGVVRIPTHITALT